MAFIVGVVGIIALSCILDHEMKVHLAETFVSTFPLICQLVHGERHRNKKEIGYTSGKSLK